MTKLAIKLPKQWKHWCANSHLRPRKALGRGYHKRGLRSTWMYLQGHGREWRLSCDGMLQCGDTYDDFDRWARCQIVELPMPKSKDEFQSAVKKLLADRELILLLGDNDE